MNARLVVHIGATGSGKSAKMHEELVADAPQSLFAWDIKGEWAKKLGIPLVTDWEIAARVLEAMKRGQKLRVAFVPPLTNEVDRERMFRRLCAHFVGDQAKGIPPIRNAALLVEEASLVLKPGGGNEALWLALVNIQARENSVSLYVIAQRPTFIDKSSLANVTKLRVFKLGYAPDMKTLAATLRVSEEAVSAIKADRGQGWARLEFIERDTDAGRTEPGILVLGRPPSAKKPPRK
jgi:hypothetical protein